MRSLALLLIFQTLMAPVLPWSMNACIAAVEACMARELECMDNCCLSSCSASAGSGSSYGTPAGSDDTVPRPANSKEQCPWCPFLTCTYGVVPMPTSSVEFTLVVPVLPRAYAPLNSALLAPVLDEAWHPPELG